jgi:LPS export ABC transporter protein LptC
MSKKSFFIALSAGALLLMGYWLRSGRPALLPHDRFQQAPAITFAGARLVKHDANGQKLWELEARQIETDETESTATEVALHFFNKENRETLIVEAAKAHLEHRTGDIRFFGAINATGSEFSFTTEDLRWDAQRKLLYTDAAIRLESEDFSLSGQGFEYSTETGLATVKRGARLQLRDQKPSP